MRLLNSYWHLVRGRKNNYYAIYTMTLKKNRLLQRIKQSDKGIDSMKCSIICE